MTGYAADEYWRVAPELAQAWLATVVDLMPACAYCVSYSRWRTAEETLARMAESDPVTHALLIKSSDGNPRRNPLVKIAADAAADMVSLAGEFGMTPVARSRLPPALAGSRRAGESLTACWPADDQWLRQRCRAFCSFRLRWRSPLETGARDV